MSNYSINQNFYWSLKYRIPIFISTLLVGFIASHLNSELYLLPIVGMFIFFLPMILKFHQLKSPYYVKITKLFLFLITFSTCIFSYILLSDIIREKEFFKPYDKHKALFILVPIVHSIFFAIALPIGFVWEKILKLDSVHFRILINQFSLLILAIFIGMMSLYVFYIGEIEGISHWAHTLVLPGLILIPWLIHMITLAKDAKKRELIFSKYLYEYERVRMDDPIRFSEFQKGSRKLNAIILLIPIIAAFFYSSLKNEEFLEAFMGILIVGVLIYRLVIRKYND